MTDWAAGCVFRIAISHRGNISRTLTGSRTPARGLQVFICRAATVAADSDVPSAATAHAHKEVHALYGRLEAKAKAVIALEEKQAASRPKVRFSLNSRIGMGDVWKLVGSCPELGRGKPEVAPTMNWSEGDVWVLHLPIRAGAHTFKAVMRRADGAYIPEAGDSRLLEVPAHLTQEDLLDVELDARLLW